MKNKVLSLIITLALLLGFIPNLSMAYSENNSEYSNVVEIKSNETTEIDGKIYKVFEINNLKVNDLLKSARSYGEFKPMAAGDKLLNWQLKVEWLGRGDSEFPFPAGGMEVTLMQSGTSKVFGKLVYNKDNIDTTTGFGTPVDFLEVENVNPSELGEQVKLGIPDSVIYDSKVFLEGTPQKGYVITATFKQKVNPLFKSEWHIKNTDKPSIAAYVIDKDDSTAKMEFDVPKNDNEIYSIYSTQMTQYYDGTSLKPVVTGDSAYKSRNEDYTGTFGENSIVLGNAADPSIEFGYGEIRSKNNTGFKNVNGKKYLLNVFGDHLTIKRYAVYESLKVKFNTGNGKLEGGEANADIGTAQEIGYSEKIANNESGRTITLPTNKLIPPEAAAGEPANEFKGWALTADATTALFKTQEEANAYVEPFTEDVTTFYAVFGPVAQGKVNVKYIDSSNGNAEITDAKYKYISTDPTKDVNDGVKLTLETKYPAEKTGDIDKTIDTNALKAPTFLGYKFKQVKTDPVPSQGDTVKYTEAGTYTIKFIYEKLDSIIPAKDDSGNDNTKVTDDVKDTYKTVTIKTDAKKGKFQKNNVDVKKGNDFVTEFVYYVNPVEGKTLQDVLNASGLTAKEQKANENKIDTTTPWTFAPDKTKVQVDVALGTEVTNTNFDVKNVDMIVNFKQTLADKFKNKLSPIDIRVWVGDQIVWNNGVKLTDNTLSEEFNKAKFNDINNLTGAKLVKQNDDTFKLMKSDGTTEVKDNELRNSSTAENSPFTGIILVTFSDGSSIEVPNQNLYVSDKIVPNNNNPIVPDNAIKVVFANGDGVAAITHDGYLVQPGTVLPNSGADNKFPTPVLDSTKTGDYKEPFIWSPEKTTTINTMTQSNEYYTVVQNGHDVFKFTVSATPKGQSTVTVKYVDENGNELKPSTDDKLQVKDEVYPTTLTGKEGTVITYKKGNKQLKITERQNAPKILGYKLVDDDTSTANKDEAFDFTSDKYTDQNATITIKYKKIDDIIGPVKPSDEQPAGYVIVKFLSDDESRQDVRGKLWLQDATQTQAPTEESKLFTELVYFVNPKANTIDLQNNKLTAKKSDKTTEINVIVNAEPVSNKFEVLLKEGNYDWKLSDKNAIAEGKVTKDLTLTVQYDGLYGRKYEYVAAGTTKTLPTEIAQPTDTTKYPVAPIKLSEIPTTLDKPEKTMLVIKEGTENKAVWFFDKWTRKVDDTNQLVTFTGQWKYFEPKGNPTTVEQGDNPDPKNNISNNGDAPKDTKYKYDDNKKPDPNKIGEQEVDVIVEVPGPNDGETTKIKVTTKVTVVEKRKDYGYFYEPSPDYLNTGAPAKKEEKVQEKYLELYRWYVKGNEMGMFMPKKGITRAEVAQMFARALEYDKAMVNVNITPYTDVDANAWYYEAVQKTSAAGIFKGSDKGTFMPTREITKAELIATIARFQHLSTKAGNTLNLQANHWATSEVEAAYQEGWLDIYTNGTVQFAADEVITRAEVVTILNRAFGRIADTKYIDDNAHTMTNFADVTKDMWSYYEIMTAANTYLVDKMWVNHATKDNGPETLKEMIEWVRPLIDNKDVREVVEQVRFQR